MNHILVVDDDKSILNGLESIIGEHFAHECVTFKAHDGWQALELLQQFPINLVVTDIKMPVMDGLELLHHITDLKLNCYVIMLSGFDDYALMRSALRKGAFDYLLKPVNIANFTKLLANILPILPKNAQPHQFILPSLPLDKAPKQTDFFDILADETLSENELQHLLQQSMESLLKLQADSAIYKLRLFFNKITAEAMSETQVRHVLIQFIYTLMERNVAYIPIIASSRLTEHDIMRCVRSLPTLSQIRTSFCDTLLYYVAFLNQQQNQSEKILIKTAKEYIQLHLEENLLLGDVAKEVHLHPNYFSSLFKQHESCTFRDYLRNVRIQRAKELMNDPKQKISEIAIQVGYQDAPHFNRAFKELTGISPSKYRRQL